jgi:hypothetical protein
VRGDADQMLAAMHDELANGYLSGFCQRIPQPGVAFVGFIAIRKQVIRLLEIAAVDFIEIDKPRHVDGVFGFELQSVNFLGLDENVVAPCVLIALDDFFFGNFFEAMLSLNAP